MKTLLVLSGAGISADSGLKTFRDSDGLWETYHVEDVATPEAWHRDPELVMRFYNERRRQVREAQPNAAHLALAELEKWYQVHIITQNVDDLHERAGSANILHLHGEITKVRSTSTKQVYPCPGDIGIGDCCPEGGQLRPHIVWFGEMVPMIEPAASLCMQADILLVVGTSLQVYPAAGLVHYVPSAAPKYVIDPKPNSFTVERNVHFIAERAADGVPRLVQKLIQDAGK